jgi:mono/diheme cytochrome c family protein/rhodanese-related sulfurtransferase
MSNVRPRRLPCAVAVVAFLLAVSTVRPPSAAAEPDLAAGAALYDQFCALCHGAKLEGYKADNAPSLSSPTFRATASDAFLQAAIERGRAGTAMAGYGTAVGGPFGPKEVDAVIAHIRGGATPVTLPPKGATGDPAKGERIYAATCQTCHGTPIQRGNAVHLANPMFLASASDAFLRVAITAGRPGTPMEPFGEKLTTQEIEDVIAYVRSLARAVPPPPAPPPPSVTNPDPVLNPKGSAPDFAPRQGRYVSVADVAKAYDEKRRMILIDARPASDYLRMHIAGAISVPYFDMHDLDRVPNDGTWVIAYCVCPHEESGRVLEELRRRGYANTAILDEGFFVWVQQGHPIAAADGQLPIAAPPAVPSPFKAP